MGFQDLYRQTALSHNDVPNAILSVGMSKEDATRFKLPMYMNSTGDIQGFDEFVAAEALKVSGNSQAHHDATRLALSFCHEVRNGEIFEMNNQHGSRVWARMKPSSPTRKTSTAESNVLSSEMEILSVEQLANLMRGAPFDIVAEMMVKWFPNEIKVTTDSERKMIDVLTDMFNAMTLCVIHRIAVSARYNIMDRNHELVLNACKGSAQRAAKKLFQRSQEKYVLCHAEGAWKMTSKQSEKHLAELKARLKSSLLQNQKRKADFAEPATQSVSSKLIKC